DLCMAAVAHYGWYNRCAAVNPYLVEGKKTVSLEICEQLGFRAPDRVYVSVGDGCTIAGVYKGFAEMHALGLTDRVPRIIGVQAEGAQAIKRAFEQNAPIVEVVSGPAETIADSISVGVPRNPIKAVEAVRKSDGYYLAVRDAEILEAMKFMGKKLGIFGEPAGVTGFAGFQRDLRAGAIDAQEEVAVIVSGNGLKDVETAIRATGDPPLVPPTLEGLTRFLAEPQAS
ncbi:MAG: pyridoxal-phosphate dependent enzyme, partial [Deltaproteobacteria bacterium]